MNPTTVKDALIDLARLAREAGADGVADESESLAQRIEEGRFFVACVGQHKRGKSTLLNALLGEPILPTGVVPLTSVVTVVRHGAVRRARVKIEDRGWVEIAPAEVASYVTEERNPGNGKGVLGAEVFVPHALLDLGMCLVDTPGIGSVFTQNTAATRELVPHIDAAIAVLGADPPISGDELELVADMDRHAQRMLFVVNKSDRSRNDDLEQACEFTQRVVSEKLGRPLERIFRVSASQRLAGSRSEEWDGLASAIDTIAQESGAVLVRAAGSRGFDRMASRLRRDLGERQDALLRPIAETEARVEHLRICARDAAATLGDLTQLFNAAHERLSARLHAIRQRFLYHALPEARDTLRRVLSRARHARPAALRREAVQTAQGIVHDLLDRMRVEITREGESEYRQATQRFAELAGAFMRRLAESGEPGLARLGDGVDFDTSVRVPSRLYYTEKLTMATASMQRSILEALLPGFLLRSSIRNGVEGYLASILETNAARIVNDFDDRAYESRRRLETEIRRHLGEVSASAQHALEAARSQQALGEGAVRAELERTSGLGGRLDALMRDTISTREREYP